jgi:DNA-binding LytR/AlgR family response regulator
MKEKYNVVIVDDEFLAQKLLQDYVSKVDTLQIVAVCSNAFEAMNALKNHQVDIMFLDIQMPDLTGLELVKGLEHKPAVIFTTAYSEYAVDAFNLSVVDYLLKPFDFPRFFQAVSKAIGGDQPVVSTEDSSSAIQQPQGTKAGSTISRSNDFITVKADYKLYKINYDDLLFIEGQHEYVTFHTTQRRITALFALKDLEEILPKDQFVRVHKSYIVSFKHIQDLDKSDVTVAGNKVPVGASYRDDLLARLQ